MKKILLVDDSQDIIDSLIRWINLMDNLSIVGTADNAKSAINLFIEIKPDIVILDINLKEGTGIEVLSEIKKINVNTIVIILTNYTLAAFKKSALENGADYFLDKTQDVDKLTKILAKLNV